MTATTKEQSQRLLECGVDPATADMCWTRFESDGEVSERLGVMDEYAYEASSLRPILAWSLAALLSLLPARIYNKESDNEESDDEEPRYDQYWFALGKVDFKETDEYEAQYTPASLTLETLADFRRDNPIEACVCMVEWLVAHGYQLSGIEKGGHGRKEWGAPEEEVFIIKLGDRV